MMTRDDLAVEQVQAGSHGWRVWRTTDEGTWWASRIGTGWKVEPRTLAADSGAELLELIRTTAAEA